MEINSFEELKQALKDCRFEDEKRIREEVNIPELIENANTLEELNIGYDLCEMGGFSIDLFKMYSMLHEKVEKISSQLFEEKINNPEELLNWLETVLNNDKFNIVSYKVVENLDERILECLNGSLSLEQDPSKKARVRQICFDTFEKMEPYKEFQIRLKMGMNFFDLKDVPAEYKEMDTLEKIDEAYKAINDSKASYQEQQQRKRQVDKVLKKLLFQYCNDVGSDEEMLSWAEEILNGQRFENIRSSMIQFMGEKIASAANQKIELAQDSNEKYRYIQIRNKTLSIFDRYNEEKIKKYIGLDNTALFLDGVAFEDGAFGITRDYSRIRVAREKDTTRGSSYLIYPQDGLIRVTIENFNPLRDKHSNAIDEILKKETGAKRDNIWPYYSEDTVAVLSETGQPLVGFIREACDFNGGNTTKIDFEANYKGLLMNIQYPYSYKYHTDSSQNQKEYDTRISNEFHAKTSIPEYPVQEDDKSNIEALKKIFGKEELDPRGIVRVGIGKERTTRS